MGPPPPWLGITEAKRLEDEEKSAAQTVMHAMPASGLGRAWPGRRRQHHGAHHAGANLSAKRVQRMKD